MGSGYVALPQARRPAVVRIVPYTTCLAAVALGVLNGVESARLGVEDDVAAARGFVSGLSMFVVLMGAATLVAVVRRGRVRSRRCPRCAERIQHEAVMCRFCGTQPLPPFQRPHEPIFGRLALTAAAAVALTLLMSSSDDELWEGDGSGVAASAASDDGQVYGPPTAPPQTAVAAADPQLNHAAGSTARSYEQLTRQGGAFVRLDPMLDACLRGWGPCDATTLGPLYELPDLIATSRPLTPHVELPPSAAELRTSTEAALDRVLDAVSRSEQPCRDEPLGKACHDGLWALEGAVYDATVLIDQWGPWSQCYGGTGDPNNPPASCPP